MTPATGKNENCGERQLAPATCKYTISGGGPPATAAIIAVVGG